VKSPYQIRNARYDRLRCRKIGRSVFVKEVSLHVNDQESCLLGSQPDIGPVESLNTLQPLVDFVLQVLRCDIRSQTTPPRHKCPAKPSCASRSLS